jgi:hypothetical protein
VRFSHKESRRLFVCQGINMNPLTKLFTAIFNPHTNKVRAVTTGDIWHFIQDQLDVAAVVEAGSMMTDAPRSYVIDIYVDDTSIYALITKGDGKLYKAPVTVSAENDIALGELQEVVMEFAPVTTGRQVTIKRSADGSVRWFAFPACTAVLNRVGEIDSTKLFDSFIDYIDRTSQYPEFDFWHLGESLPLGKADWVGREGVAYCASGTFYDTPIARAAAKAMEEDPDYWGLSIAYAPIQEPEMLRSAEGIEIPVFNVGINRFISLLPENTAASILTKITTKEEVNRMNDKMKAALKKLTGEDEALFSELELKLDTVVRQVAGMISRDTTPAPVTPEVVPPAVSLDEQITAIMEKVLAAHTPAPVVVEVAAPEPVAEKREIDPLVKMIADLTAKVDELSKSRDASIQEVLDDLPAKIVRQQIVRPRGSVLNTPDLLGKNNRVNMAEIASQTLAQIEASN